MADSNAKSSNLNIRLAEEYKDKLSGAALRAGLIRLENGKPAGNVSALITLLANAVERMSDDELKALLFSEGE